MRILIILSVIIFLAGACAKPKTKDPVPNIEFVDLIDPRISPVTGGDTATLHLRYEDGDGDLFVDHINDGSNVVITPYFFDKTIQAFRADFNPDPNFNDSIRIITTVKQPDNGYYKGKSIRGDLFIPLTSFRSDNSKKVIKFTGFMVDMAGNKSNTFASPAYTLNF